jgi:hypothetical protein
VGVGPGQYKLELVPYATPDFPTGRLSVHELSPHFQRVLDVISAYERRYVLFCGAVFEKLLKQSGYELQPCGTITSFT